MKLRSAGLGIVAALAVLVAASMVALAHGKVDQENASVDDPNTGFCTSLLPAGQTFVPQANNIVALDIYLGGRLGPGHFDLEVRQWPSGPSLATVSADLQVGENHVDLAAAAPLTPGQKYAILVTGSSLEGEFCTVFVTDDYLPGCFVHDGAEVCSEPAFPPTDMFFRTYFDSDEAAAPGKTIIDECGTPFGQLVAEGKSEKAAEHKNYHGGARAFSSPDVLAQHNCDGR